MRDYLCKPDILKEIIAYDEEFILKDEKAIISLQEDIKNGIQRFPKRNEDIIYAKRKGILREINELIRAKYSAGYDCKELYDIYIKSVFTMKEMDGQEIGFVNFIQFFSLGILLEVEIELLMVLVKYADVRKLDGKLIDFLAQACGLHRSYQSIGYGKENPYKKLEKMIKKSFEDKKEAEIELQKYMEDFWLQGHRDFDWHTAHKRADYVGFWSFETAALVKILKLDDSKLKDSNHYPYDLAHYKTGMTFQTECPMERNREKKTESQFMYEEMAIDTALEQLIPYQFYELIHQIVLDYGRLSDQDFWEIYQLRHLGLSLEKYIVKNQQRTLLGEIIVNKLAEKDYILQLDYKESLEDHIDDLRNYWGDEATKLVAFELENDQKYYAYVPEKMDRKMLYGVKIFPVWRKIGGREVCS